MTRADVPGQWLSTQQFAVISTARRRKLVANYEGNFGGVGDVRLSPATYLEVDNRGNKGPTIYYALNGRTASSSLATGADEVNQPLFRLPPDSIDRIFVKATSISVVATSNSTVIYLTVARF